MHFQSESHHQSFFVRMSHIYRLAKSSGSRRGHRIAVHYRYQQRGTSRSRCQGGTRGQPSSSKVRSSRRASHQYGTAPLARKRMRALAMQFSPPAPISRIPLACMVSGMQVPVAP